MRRTHDADIERSYQDRIRAQYDTTNLAAIMGRFYQAVSR